MLHASRIEYLILLDFLWLPGPDPKRLSNHLKRLYFADCQAYKANKKANNLQRWVLWDAARTRRLERTTRMRLKLTGDALALIENANDHQNCTRPDEAWALAEMCKRLDWGASPHA